MVEATNGIVQKFTEVAKLKMWLSQFIPVDSLSKKDINEFLEDPNIDPSAREALRMRIMGAQAAAAKYEAILSRIGPDNRVRDCFVYHAAGPGRWSSRGIQVHNLKRNPFDDEKETEKAIACIYKGSYETMLKSYPNPLKVIGDCIRGALCAAPKHTLIGADFSGIEARVDAWLAGEKSKLEVFRKYDAKEGPDPYIVTASKIYNVPPEKITKDQRQVGKGAELAFGYQGGVAAYKKFLSNATFTDEEIDEIKRKWRAAHPRIVALWYDLQLMADRAVRRPGYICSIEGGRPPISFDYEADARILWCTLPSGRKRGR